MAQAVFFVCTNEDDLVLCVTRPLEKQRYPGDFGLPGGIVEEGEELLEALFRECEEEGVHIIYVDPEPLFSIFYGEKDLLVTWFMGTGSFIEGDFKEKLRINQVYKTKTEVAQTTMGNNFVMELI